MSDRTAILIGLGIITIGLVASFGSTFMSTMGRAIGGGAADNKWTVAAEGVEQGGSVITAIIGAVGSGLT